MSLSDCKKEQLKALATEYDDFCTKMQARAMKIIGTHKIRIISDWNGQPYGTSRPSRNGKDYAVEGVNITNGAAFISLRVTEHPYDDGPTLRDVEFI